jgi:N-acyl-D-aspartate/D-glutamate deacylase
MLQGPTDAERAKVLALARASGRPVLWNALLVNSAEPEYQDRLLHTGVLAAQEGERVIGLTMPGPQTLRFAFTNVFVISIMEGWEDLFLLDEPARIAALADPAVRDRMRIGLREGGAFKHRRLEDVRMGECTVRPERNGQRLGDLAAAHGVDPLDELCDIAVEERLGCGFWPRPLGDDAESWANRAEIWRRPDVLLGGSDAGAHLDVIADFSYPTAMLGPLVRDRAPFSVEEAVRLITDVPARLFGLEGRGRIAPGYAADLVVFDPERIAPGEVELRADLPAGARRLWSAGVGINSVWVNGEQAVADGAVAATRSGQVLRSRPRS